MILSTGDGNDTIDAGPGDDMISDTGGSNSIRGGQGNDKIVSGPGNDTIKGDDGDDTVLDMGGHNILKGNSGNDCLAVYNDTTSQIDGGLGTDYCCGGGTRTNCETSLATCPSLASLPSPCHLP
jgi:Ca2+-binding RTX toxin-like protein